MAANYLILLSEDPAILPGLIARAPEQGRSAWSSRQIASQ